MQRNNGALRNRAIYQGSGNGKAKFKGRSILADASSRLLRQLGEKLLRAFLHLGRGQVFDVLRERPNVAEWVLDATDAIAPEHVGRRRPGARAGGGRERPRRAAGR